jgi:N-acetylglucosamine malate deacetylase 1
MGLHARENLNLADGFFRNTPEQQMPVIQAIRKYRPEVVLCNSISDRHPDHGRASELVKEACFYSGLPKIITELDGKQQEHWRPKAVYHYIQDNYLQPDFVVDITPYMEQRIAAMRAFRTQIFVPGVDVEGIETPISSEIFWEYMMARLRLFGRLIGVEYGEGFNTGRAIGVDDLMKLG